MSESYLVAISTFLVALIGMITGVYATYAQRKEKRASAERISQEADKIAEEVTKMVLERARDEVRILHGENEYLIGENLALKKRVNALEEVYDEIKQLRRKHKEAMSENLALKERVEELENEYHRLLAVVQRLEIGVRQLCKQLHDSGQEPVFTIDEDE